MTWRDKYRYKTFYGYYVEIDGIFYKVFLKIAYMPYNQPDREYYYYQIGNKTTGEAEFLRLYRTTKHRFNKFISEAEYVYLFPEEFI